MINRDLGSRLHDRAAMEDPFEPHDLQNPWLRLREDLVELPSGRTTVYGVVSTGSCVGVLPFLDPDTVVLVRQYRYVAGRHTWEMPRWGRSGRADQGRRPA